jgi:hypothetical protein
MRTLLLRLLILTSLLFSIATAQTAEDPEQVLNEAFGLYLNGDSAEALSVYRDIAQRYRGSQPGLRALHFLYENTKDDSDAIAILQQIIGDFPNSLAETKARLELLANEFERVPDPAAFLQGCDDIARQLGGPTYAEIVSSGNSPEIGARIRALGSDKQKRLLPVYLYMTKLVGSSQSYYIPGDVGDVELGKKFLNFLHLFTPLGK